MQVAQDKLTGLMVALGVDTAADWDAAKLATKVNASGGVAKYKDENTVLADAEHVELFDAIAADQELGNVVEVVPSVQPETAAVPGANGKPTVKKKPAAKPKKKPAKPAVKKKPAAPTGMKWKDRKAWLAKNPKVVSERGPVMFAIVGELKHAGKGYADGKHKPVTKEHLLGVLKEKFPDRDPVKMDTYLNNVVPTALRDEYAIHVWKQKSATPHGKTGYFIVGDGAKPQPETAAEPKPAAKPKKKPAAKPPAVKKKPAAKPKKKPAKAK